MKRNKHNLSHTHLMTGDMGKLYPIGCVEALPGDAIQHHVNVLARVSPLAAPVMHPVTARVHHFFVANRTLWDGEKTGDSPGSSWENFITGGEDGMNLDTPPQIPVGNTEDYELLDYLGIPQHNSTLGVSINALPVRAVNACFNEFYRDQDLVDKRDKHDTTIPNIAWGKDYFTSARPWTQKGPDVTIPLGDSAPVTHDISGSGQRIGVFSTVANDHMMMSTGGVMLETSGSSSTPEDSLYADLSQALGANVNDVRKAFAIQRYQEARARYGSRYTEYLRYLGISPQDSRLQRPEFLGGGRTQLNFSEIMQTAPETGIAPSTEFGVGDLYGHGIAAMRSNKYRRFIPEHGYIISFLSVRPKSIYQNGIHRSWLRQTKEDYFQKELQHIGQQEIYNNEVYADVTNGKDVFGYQDRYSDYREHPSRVSGEFRDVLNYWHMARDFSAAPVLNSSFVECDATKRIHNEQTKHALWVMCQHKMVARRIVSRNAAPRVF